MRRHAFSIQPFFRRALIPVSSGRCACAVVVAVFALFAALGLYGSRAHAQTSQAAPSSKPSAATPDPSFDILEFVVEGNRVLEPLAIERAVYPFLGPRRLIRDVDAARAALEKAYHQAGYLTVTVDVPEQQVEHGIVRLAVTEGRVERLRVSGSRYYDQGYIRARVPSLAPGAVPDFPKAQDELEQVSRSQDRRVTPILRPGRAPGTVEVELKVEDRLPLHANIELNNRRSANTSALRLGGGIRYDNLWQRDHSVGLQFQTAPQETDDVKVLSATYAMPLGSRGSQLVMYAVESRSDVASLGSINVIGDGTILGLRWVRPLRGAADFVHSLSLGLDRKDFRESVVLLGADSVNTPITYTPLAVQYNATWLGERRKTSFMASSTIGVRGLLGNDDREFSNKRFNARSNFIALKLDLGHERWSKSGWGVIGRLDLQLADQPLISNEQFSAGGAESVRGYFENEVQGDDGVRFGLELHTPPLFVVDAKAGGGLTALAFIEAASLRVQDPLPEQRARFDLASAGLGLRVRGLGRWGGALDIAWPLRDGAQNTTRSSRWLFRLSYEF